MNCELLLNTKHKNYIVDFFSRMFCYNVFWIKNVPKNSEIILNRETCIKFIIPNLKFTIIKRPKQYFCICGNVNAYS